jgi:hypothetical protein
MAHRGIERSLNGAELLDELDRSLVADAGSAGDVVDGVATQGHDIDHARGSDAEGCFYSSRIEDEIVFGRVQNDDLIVDQLHHVLVRGDNEHLVPGLCELAGEGADDVVGLEALVGEDGDAEGLERAADVGQLLGKVGGHLGAIGLIAEVVDLFELLRLEVELLDRLHLLGALVAEDGAGEVVDGGEVVRLEVLAQLVDHVHEDIGRRRRDAGARGHGALALHGMVGTEDEGHAVEQVDGGLFGGLRGGVGR